MQKFKQKTPPKIFSPPPFCFLPPSFPHNLPGFPLPMHLFFCLISRQKCHLIALIVWVQIRIIFWSAQIFVFEWRCDFTRKSRQYQPEQFSQYLFFFLFFPALSQKAQQCWFRLITSNMVCKRTLMLCHISEGHLSDLNINVGNSWGRQQGMIIMETLLAKMCAFAQVFIWQRTVERFWLHLNKLQFADSSLASSILENCV